MKIPKIIIILVFTLFLSSCQKEPEFIYPHPVVPVDLTILNDDLSLDEMAMLNGTCKEVIMNSSVISTNYELYTTYMERVKAGDAIFAAFEPGKGMKVSRIDGQFSTENRRSVIIIA